MSKRYIYLMGLITLLAFPLPSMLWMHYFEGMDYADFFQVKNFKSIPILYGLEFGIVYAYIAILLLKAPIFDRIPLKFEHAIKAMNLNYIDGFFLSLCAGVGEEILFRSGMQYYAGIWITSLFFVAIHGYFSIKKPLMSLYGMVVLPFILIISLGFNHFGLWFSISAHFAYDIVLMYAIISDKSSSSTNNR